MRLVTLAALGIFLAGTAIGALLSAIVFFGRLRDLKDSFEPPHQGKSRHHDPGPPKDDRDAA